MAYESEHTEALAAIEATAKRLAEQGAAQLLEIPATLRVDLKRGDEPVTELDRRIERTVVEQVRSAFPDHCVLGEESGLTDSGGDWLWVVDPIDGTWNLVNGFPTFAVSVCALYRGVPAAAATALPSLGQVFHTRAGGGLARNGHRLPAPSRPAVTDTLPTGVLPPHLGSHFHLDPEAGRWLARDHRWLGSTASETALIAAGTFAFGVFPPMPVWDIAAGLLLITESGGSVRCAGPDGAWEPFAGFRQHSLAGDPRVGPFLAGTSEAVEVLSTILHPLPE